MSRVNYLESSQEENDELMEILAEIHQFNYGDGNPTSREAEEAPGASITSSSPGGSLYEEMVQFQRRHSIDGSEEDVASVVLTAVGSSSSCSSSTAAATTTEQDFNNSSSNRASAVRLPRRQSAPPVAAAAAPFAVATRRASTATTPGRQVYRQPVSRDYFKAPTTNKNIEEGGNTPRSAAAAAKTMLVRNTVRGRKPPPAATDVVLPRPSLTPSHNLADAATTTTSLCPAHTARASSNPPSSTLSQASRLASISCAPIISHHRLPFWDNHDGPYYESDEELARRLQEEFDRAQQQQQQQQHERSPHHKHHHQHDVRPHPHQQQPSFNRWDATRNSGMALPVSLSSLPQHEPTRTTKDSSPPPPPPPPPPLTSSTVELLEAQRRADAKIQQERDDFQFALRLAKMQHDDKAARLSFASSESGFSTVATASLTEQDSSFDSLDGALPGAFALGRSASSDSAK